jgi:hypothetical protein
MHIAALRRVITWVSPPAAILLIAFHPVPMDAAHAAGAPLKAPPSAARPSTARQPAAGQSKSAPSGTTQSATEQSATAQPGTTQSSTHEFPQPRAFLTKDIGLSNDEIDAAAKGTVITQNLDSPAKDEMALFGIAWIEVPIDFYLKHYEDIESFERGDAIKAIKKLSNPPQLSDFDQLSFSADDLKDLPDCRPGHCSVKIDEKALERLQKEVDWTAADAADKANALFREIMLGFVQEYLKEGNAALPVYVDSKDPTSVSKAFSGLLEDSPYLPEYVPELNNYLTDFPETTLPGATEFLYWSTNDIGLKPLTVLTQVVVYPWEQGGNVDAIIAGKQLYAGHYFHAALELRFLIRDSSRPDATGFYLITIDRSRSDGLTGIKGGLIGGTLRRRSREGLQSYLEHSKARLEQEYQKSQ